MISPYIFIFIGVVSTLAIFWWGHHIGYLSGLHRGRKEILHQECDVWMPGTDDTILQDDNIPTLLNWKKITKEVHELQNKNPIKRIDEKGSILPYLKCPLMIHPLNMSNIRLRLSSVIEKAHLDPIKTPAVILSMSGAVLVAMPTTFFRMIGFGTWMISNSLWVIQGKKVNDFYLMLLFSFYFITSAIGVVNIT